jgi:hypothetical protein
VPRRPSPPGVAGGGGWLSLCGGTGVKLLLSLEFSVTPNDANEKQKSMLNRAFGGGKNKVDMYVWPVEGRTVDS